MSRSVGVWKHLYARLLPPLCTASQVATFKNRARLKRQKSPHFVSPQMQSFLHGVSAIPRALLRVEVWDYIRLHNLHDPENKNYIICDEKLKTIFDGMDRVEYREVDRLLEAHIYKRIVP